MAATLRVLDASPLRVWRAVTDARQYPQWVLAAREIRGVDEDWPAPGSALRHTVGVGPVEVRDDTTVLDCVPERLLVLRARVRPLGTAIVRIELHAIPEGGGCAVVMDERLRPAWPACLAAPLLDRVVGVRNHLALHRLGELCAGTAR